MPRPARSKIRRAPCLPADFLLSVTRGSVPAGIRVQPGLAPCLIKSITREKETRMKYSALQLRILALAAMSLCSIVRADVVTEWSSNLDQVIVATAQAVPPQARFCAIVHTAMYDAINGIVGAYQPYFVTEAAPAIARPDAAGIAAAYATMVSLYPAQKPTLDLMYSNSLQNLGGDTNSPAIASGLAWGQHVANLVLAFRANDGFNTTPAPYLGGGAPGVWRSPPSGASADGTLPAVFPQLATLVPFAMTNHAQFRPGPPPALTSAQYAADVNEVQLIGRVDSPTRTSDQTQLALLWQAVGAVDENRIVRAVAPATNSLVDNARLFALVNIAAADAVVAAFDSKYTYNFWRPYHAIRLGDTNSNPALTPDPTWNCLFVPPRFQEYMSAHASLTGAIMHTLAALLGDNHTFTLAAPGYPAFTWTFNKFSDATAQVKEARIWAGIHFRNSCNVGETQGTNLANYVLSHLLAPAVSTLPIVNPADTFEGKTYAQWSAEHWKWLYSLPADNHPLFDTASVSAGQTGDVWFLGGTFTTTTSTNGTMFGAATRNVSIPQGKALFFPLIDTEASTAEGNGTNDAQLLAAAQGTIDSVDTLSCIIDGQSVPNLSAYRAASDLFTWGPLPTNNVFGDPANFPAGTTSPSVADGYYLLLQPLPPGDHTIHFTGGVPGFQLDIAYNIMVTPTNGVYPPDSVIYGKTYSQWAAGFAQWWFGLAISNNPLLRVSPYPQVPLGSGQSGPAWYIGAFNSGTVNHTTSMPAGTALVACVAVAEWDNSDCPHNDNYTTSQLLAMAASQVNTYSQLSCIVDGVAVAGLTNVMTTPYRVQSVFNLVEPPLLNFSYYYGLSCYRNFNGIPYTITNAVNDAIMVVIPPLSVGTHTVYTSLQSSSGLQAGTWTINVTSPPPSLVVGQSSRNLSLSWPQNALNYTVEATSTLSPPHWQPANLPVQTTEGFYQVTAPVGTNNQFFRLRSH